MPYNMTKRRRQNEKAGCFTDEDGYKRSPTDTSEWHSGQGRGVLRPPITHWSPKDGLRDYPCDGERAIMTKAIKQRWPITREIKEAVVEEMIELVKGAEDPVVKVGAARVLATAEKQNQDDKLKRRRDKVAIQNIIAMGEPAPPDPDYLEWKRQKLGAETISAESAPQTSAESALEVSRPPLAALVDRVKQTG